MKKNIAVILACLMLAGSAAGCAGQKNGEDSSAQSAASQTESVASQTASGEEKTPNDSGTESAASQTETSAADDSSELPDPGSDIVIDIDGDGSGDPGVSIDEDGNIIIDPEQFSGWEEDPDDGDEPEAPEDPLSEIQYMLISLAPDGFGTGFDKPAAYTVTSEDELAKFVKDNEAKFSLSKTNGDSGDDFFKGSFKDATADSTADFFEGYDMIILVTPYSKSGSVDLGDISADESGDLNAVIWTQLPADDSDKGYACIIVEIAKGAVKDKKVNVTVDPNAYIDDAPAEEGGEEGGEGGEESGEAVLLTD